MRSSYASHYRRMLPPLLTALKFRSNNAMWRPILTALDQIVWFAAAGRRVVPEEGIPSGLIPAKWRNAVMGESGRVNVIALELCVLTQLRERIRAKEIWVEGADRYCNPDDDLLGDFAERRDAYYADLRLPQDSKSFVARVKADLEQELFLLNATLPDNDKVRLRWSGENRISVTPLTPVPEPPGLAALKSEVARAHDWVAGCLEGNGAGYRFPEQLSDLGQPGGIAFSSSESTLAAVPLWIRDQRGPETGGIRLVHCQL